MRELRHAIDAVTQGGLDVSVPVDDGSEVGRLQAGFNGMVAGLREREQLRDLYGRQVGADVAREALERGTALGGATCEVSALFVDCGLDAAIGVACGTVVAGYVGAEARFEYTVVGDPVNEAARWCGDGEVVLRGRECPTRIAVPVSPRVGRSLAPAGRAEGNSCGSFAGS